MNEQRPSLRQYSREEVSHIIGYEQMGQELTVHLTADSPITLELSAVLHDEETLGYRDVLQYYFFESNRGIHELLESPFVRSFQQTHYYSESDAQVLDAVRNFTGDESNIPESLMNDFNEWVRLRIKFMTKGLQWFVLHGGVIDPYTEKELRNKSSKLMTLWRSNFPQQAQAAQEAAVKAAREVSQPLVFTDEVRAQIQRWFDKGHTYETVVELLRGIQIETSLVSLKKAVRVYDDLHYTPAEMQKQQREGFVRAAGEIFSLSRSTKKTAEILEALGYSEAQTYYAFKKLGIKAGFRWTDTVIIGGQEMQFQEIVSMFSRGTYLNVTQEYQDFISYLKDNNIEVDINIHAYTGIRRRVRAKAGETNE